MPIAILPYSRQYQNRVINLILTIQREEFGIDITVDDQPDLKKIEAFYQLGHGNFWIALDAEIVVGTVALLDLGSGLGALRKMFVSKDYRGHPLQVGQILFDELLTWAKEKKLCRLFLGTTDKFVAAHRFYEKNKFKIIDRDKLPSAFPIMKVDTRFYVYELSE